MAKKTKVLPKSALGKGIKDKLNRWKYLGNYILDGRCEKASVIIYSIIEKAKENGLKPMNYLACLFVQQNTKYGCIKRSGFI